MHTYDYRELQYEPNVLIYKTNGTMALRLRG